MIGTFKANIQEVGKDDFGDYFVELRRPSDDRVLLIVGLTEDECKAFGLRLWDSVVLTIEAS